MVSLNNLGLLFDIGGCIILFFYGPPIPKLLPDGSGVILATPDKESEKTGKSNYRISQIGLILLIVGFIFQFVGNYTENKKFSAFEKHIKQSISIQNEKINMFELKINEQIKLFKKNEDKLNKQSELSDNIKERLIVVEDCIKEINSKTVVIDKQPPESK